MTDENRIKPKTGFDLEEKDQPHWYWYQCKDVEKGYIGTIGKGPKKNDPLVFGVEGCESSHRCDVTNMHQKKSQLDENELANQMWEIVRNPEGKILRLHLTYTA